MKKKQEYNLSMQIIYILILQKCCYQIQTLPKSCDWLGPVGLDESACMLGLYPSSIQVLESMNPGCGSLVPEGLNLTIKITFFKMKAFITVSIS